MTKGINWLLLINAILGRFLSGLSARIFMISLPSMAKGLGTDILGISWALISFQLASASLSIVFGRLGDIYGRRTIYGLGFIVLTVSSFLCGISQNVLQLIVFRFLQGVGGAMTESASRALALDAMPEGYEGKAQGVMTAAFHSGFFVGPPLGGFIIDYIHWRGVFFFIVPIGLAGIVLSTMVFKGSSDPAALERRLSVDYLGAVLLILLMGMLTLLLDRKTLEVFGVGEKSFLTIAFAGTLWGFLAHEKKSPSPMMNLALFKIGMFTYSIISLFTLSITRGLVGFLLPFYLQEILHISPSFMGIMFLAPPIFTVTLAPVGGHITDRIGPRVPATIGVLASLTAVMIGAILRVDSHWTFPTFMLALTGIGTAFFNSANQAAIIGSVPKGHRGFANGMIHSGFELGHMLGVSLGALLLSLSFQYYSGIPGATPDPGNAFAFVSSMNASYGAAVVLSLVAMLTSLMRGSGKIQAAETTDR
ncbi:MAG: MFS transporter [Deltaproteobacteria bacterium]|nr:MFS transporter [Deltaproteobacteria bacterium]